MPFTYYKAVKNEEHMLYSKEIAFKYGLVLGDQPRNRLVSSILRKYIRLNLPEYECLYYKHKFGLSEVFPASIYEPAMEEYMEKEGLINA